MNLNHLNLKRLSKKIILTPKQLYKYFTLTLIISALFFSLLASITGKGSDFKDYLAFQNAYIHEGFPLKDDPIKVGEQSGYSKELMKCWQTFFCQHHSDICEGESKNTFREFNRV